MIDNQRRSADMKFQDDESPYFMQGAFGAYILEDEELVWKWEKKNVIVNDARKIMSHVIGDCSVEDDSFICINQFRLGGDNSLSADKLLTPDEPKKQDTDIVYTDNLFIRTRQDLGPGDDKLMTVSYPNAPNETSVMFTTRVLRTEGNILYPDPTVYVCAGLFAQTVDESKTLLFASQSMPVMTKTPNREFIFEWTIQF